MSNFNKNVAEKFWKNRSIYPNYPNLIKRRLVDLNFMVPFLDGASSILDLGCGDGYLLRALRDFTDIETFYGYDMSNIMIESLKKSWGNLKYLNAEVCDFVKKDNYPKTDITMALGSFMYIDDNDLRAVLSNMVSDILILRSSCTLEKEDEIIDKFSEDLSDNYSAIYRTVGNYIAILSDYFAVDNICRSYPDEIESKYGSKQFFFVCEREGK